MKQRKSGVLLHITSLPSRYGVGDLGPCAYEFVDFLQKAGQSYWQILPVNPTGTIYGNAPYSGYSAFAGNPMLISPDFLLQTGLLNRNELEPVPHFHTHTVDFKAVIKHKGRILRTAYENCRTHLADDADFQRFCAENESWLEDYSLWVALREHFKEVPWTEWPKELRDRDEAALKRKREEFADRRYMAKFYQYVFDQQWMALKRYCDSKQVKLIGDVPIYVSNDSSDVWANTGIFKLDENKNPIYVSGAPPDYFSETGQRWGNPVFDWEVMKKDGYSWWMRRLGHNMKLCHMIRLDHFRGFVAYWEIPVSESTAINGKWIPAPAMDFFTTVRNRFQNYPIIAEDLGVITPDVKEVIRHFGLPGMKILLFAFGNDLPTNPYAPHNYTNNCVVYTGTHDNNTVRGWLDHEARPEDKRRLFEYVGREDHPEMHWDVIRLAMTSVADLVIVPMQDILGLGQEARMNHPSRTTGNWAWRYTNDQITQAIIDRLTRLTWLTGRAA